MIRNLLIAVLAFGAVIEAKTIEITVDGQVRSFWVDENIDSSEAANFAISFLETPLTERDALFGNFIYELHAGAGETTTLVRNYWADITEQERAHVTDIVNTLADTPTPKLLFQRGRLDEIGDKVNHLHPFNFLIIIFGDDKLKVKVKNIKSRSLVWKGFFDGVKNSMAEEARKGNILPEQINDFAAKVGIKPSLIQKPIEMKRYDTFVNILIDNIKRNEEHDRYNL